MFKTGVEKMVRSLLDNGSRLQAPAVARYVDNLRRKHPTDNPAQLIARLERRFVFMVTASGTTVGAIAAVPGIGTILSLFAMTAETAFFLEAAAVFTLAVAAVHGIVLEDRERRRALVLGVALGETGMRAVEQGVGKSAKNWPDLLANKIPGIRGMNDGLMKRFVVQLITKRAVLMFGKVLPAGIGAVVGGFGNRVMGKSVVGNARKAFGPAPAAFPAPGSDTAVPSALTS
ncbi:hypothetical protein [Nocardia pseudobrasiliensis]|uniref:EcsC family protein n=1 Tax=Nocardia pseudobrasiliensis TaxID=45979 RepID=A0A370HWJ2_9NOCA|nr:hypothetical protein [Nocardia pseudobrasiliensis]RDI62869.1 hypothetical protein DFR76_112187 [Nocardia pseudobrasiliensis]